MAISKAGLNISIPNTTLSTGSAVVDSESKNLQNQLMSEQRRLKQLSSDSEMSAEEKEKERQEIQQQIAELNRKLRMERMEQKEEVKKAAKEREQKSIQQKELHEEVAIKSQKETENSKEVKKEMQDSGLSVQDVRIMFAADSLLQQERIRVSADRVKESREGVLEAEIQLDSIHGNDTESKKEELSALRKESAFQFEIEEIGTNRKSDKVKNASKIIIRES